MAVIEKFGPDVRVFKQNLCPQEAPLQPESFGLFWIRLNATLYNPCVEDDESRIEEAATVPISQVDLWYLNSLSGLQELLNGALRKLHSLSSCNSIDWIVSSLAEHIHCKFFFSHEFMSGRGPRPVIFLDLEVVMRREASETSSVDCNLDHNLDNGAAQQTNDDHDLINNHWIDLEFGKSDQEEGSNDHVLINDHWVDLEIGGIDQGNLECQSEEIICFDEVKADLEIKVFERSDDSEVQLCPICLEDLVEGLVVADTSCFHTFHKGCLFRWLLDSISCPICRSTCVACV